MNNDYEKKRAFVRIDEQLILHYSIPGLEHECPEERQRVDLAAQTAYKSDLEYCIKFLERIHREIGTLSEVLDGLLTRILDEQVSATVDVSGGGLSFCSGEEISPGTRLTLRLESVDPPYLSASAIGEVCRCDKIEPQTSDMDSIKVQYDVHVKFVDISEPDREMLIKYIFEKQREFLQSRKDS